MKGKLIILTGPSGAGKSTIAKHLLKIKDFNLVFSISACSRKKREGEVDGKDYFFYSIDTFKTKIEENEFLEWEEVYPQHYYGTLRSQVEELRSSGKNVVFDVDVMGGINIKREYKENAISIFISPPSLEELELRLKSRNTESQENISRRLRKAKMEMAYAKKFDQIIENDKLDNALKTADSIVAEFLQSEK
jgi:guanylate kinase